MARHGTWRDLSLRFVLQSLMVDVHLFKWATPAFKTKWTILGRRRSTQLFLGPLHVWRFEREGELLVLEARISMARNPHGKFTPDGDSAAKYYWGRVTGRIPPDSADGPGIPNGSV